VHHWGRETIRSKTFIVIIICCYSGQDPRWATTFLPNHTGANQPCLHDCCYFAFDIPRQHFTSFCSTVHFTFKHNDHEIPTLTAPSEFSSLILNCGKRSVGKSGHRQMSVDQHSMSAIMREWKKHDADLTVGAELTPWDPEEWRKLKRRVPYQ
jgi:hypothetical protein